MPSTISSIERVRNGQSRVPLNSDPYPPLTARDRVITRDVRECLATHLRLRSRDIRVNVRGGVAHVTGLVASAQERELTRRVIARVHGVQAVWDNLLIDENEPLRIIDIGCGPNKQYPWAIGVDCFEHPQVDVVTDLEEGLPFEDEEVDHVYAVHCLEHIRNLLGLMNEIHRVLRPGGMLHVLSPHWQFVNAVADPTHVRFLDRQTFKYFCRPAPNLRLFRPFAAANLVDNVFADLQPVKRGESPADELELARFFD